MSKVVLNVTLSDDGKQYRINCDKGISVNEMMFGVAVAIRCLVRDKVIDKSDVAINMLNRYLNDEQFAEVKENT